MEATIKVKSENNDMQLLLVIALLSTISYLQLSVPHFLPTSKIEEGEVIVRNDSITTVVIPDRR